MSKKAAKKYSKLFSIFINPSEIMEHQKLFNLLNEVDSKFVTRKWNVVNNQFNENYGVNKIIYNTEVLKSNLCDYNDT